MQTIRIEPQREIPVAKSVDVLVAGGGPAGIAAALAAVREGADTLLVERYGYLGGMITGCHVVVVMGVGDGFRPKARGITKEIRDRLEPLGGISRTRPSGDYAVDAELFKWQADEMLAEAGAAKLLQTLACAPIVEDGRVRGFFAESKSGRQALLAKVTVDCTADADLAFRAGCPCDNETHDVSLRIVVEGVEQEKADAFAQEKPDEYERIMAEAAELNGGHPFGQKGKRVKGVDVTDAEALGRAESQMRRELFRALYHLRAHLPGWEDARVAETSPQFGVRQSRRVRGGHVVTDEELSASRHHEDSVARLGSYLNGYKLYDPKGLDYDIPYRALVPEGADGLLVAGRCVSADYLAANTLRLIVPCFATGQAAGAAAALAAKAGVQPRQVPYPELRQALLRQDVHLSA